ncbi:MAG: hypothetical protein JST26_05480 [Bacteroidetes bacterium]|nr:hypothetical protein [Bacteroidota bacterium]
MDYGKLIAILFGATGFWHVLEFFLRLYTNRKKEAFELKNLQAQTESSVIRNWQEWSQALERRVKELEIVAHENKELKKQIESQRSRITELESKVEKVEKENQQLRFQLQELTKP